jgi:DNA repair exonuclease SbcCD ATPase subunit
MPEQEALQKAVSTASSIDPKDFVDERAYQLEKIRTMAALTGLEALAEQQKSDAEKMVEAIEASMESASAAYEAQLAALDRAEESAAAWRERELARVDQQIAALGDWRDKQISALDAMLLEAQEQVGRLENTWQATLSVKDALDQLNKLLVEGGAKPVTPPITPPAPDLSGIATALQATAASSQAAAVATQTTTNETVALKAEIISLRKDLAAANTASVSTLKSLDDRLKKWDLDGVPPGRDDVDVILTRAA